MLQYVYGDELPQIPALSNSMFRDRAIQFKERPNWDVRVDNHGYERDEYDGLNPLYVIWENERGLHGGSIRFLPTTADTMVRDHFQHLTDGVPVQSPFIWECTRFCLSDDSDHRVAALLMLAALEIGLNFHLTYLVGAFDARMARNYRRVGWEPSVLGTTGKGHDAISVGLWDCDYAFRDDLLARADVSAKLSQFWFNRSVGGKALRTHSVGQKAFEMRSIA